MKEKNNKNKKKSEMNAMFFIILIALVMFIISTYAWFSTQKDVSITNLTGTVEVAEGLEISLDAKTWANSLVLGSDTEDGLSITENAYPGNKNISPSEMLPVSTLGVVSGNQTDLKMLRGKIEDSKKLSDIKSMIETESNPQSSTFPGYFAFDVFLKNSSKDASKDDELQLNYNSSLEILEADKKTTGLQNTARIGLALYNGTTSTTAEQDEILKQTANIGVGSSAAYITNVAIWEPNSSDHVDYIVANNNKVTWSSADTAKYATKKLDNGSNGFDVNTQLPTYALKDSSIGATIPDIYKWDGSETNIQKQYTLQTTKKADEDYTVKEGVQNLVSTTDGSTKFTIPADKICRLRVYLWLEGQDVDCINYASHGGGIKVNLGLVKGSTVGATGPEVE